MTFLFEEKFGDTKGDFRRTGKTMAKKKKDKNTNNDLQNITQKTKDRATLSRRKTCGGLRYATRG